MMQNLNSHAYFADDGGGMDPELIRKCMSLGYSSKKSNTTIGQCNSYYLSCFIGFFSLTKWFCLSQFCFQFVNVQFCGYCPEMMADRATQHPAFMFYMTPNICLC